MPPPSLLSLLPAASISPQSRRAKHHKAPTASQLLCLRRAVAHSPLRASPSSSSAAADGGGGGSGVDELHLLEKPSPTVAEDAEAEEEPEPAPVLSTEEALAPFLKFFQVNSTDPDEDTASSAERRVESDAASAAAAAAARRDGVSAGGRGVRYYDPKPGDFVAGVVVRSDGRTLDVDVGAGGQPALMLPKEAVPVSGEEFRYLACDVASGRAGEFAAEGRVGVMVRQVGGGEGDGEPTGGRNGKEKGAPVVGVGTIVFAEVLGRTLGGRPLLSARRLFRRVAWHRVRQIKQLNVPIKVKIFEWNAGGLLSRIEGLRAFLPKPEMMTRPRNFIDLKNKVGQEMHVCITRIDEGTNELIISEKEAWAVTYLREGTLLQGTVRKLFPYGAQIRIGETNRGKNCQFFDELLSVPGFEPFHVSFLVHPNTNLADYSSMKITITS
ncbi:protein PIGMENT DEFECTIVE 338, chloroplastic-like isoform X2 [Phragmites australis]|uniref:protein PIGMENT DEFECTIVE 338, chloroplastic-like isoform X2 n=1 Tax=Phragmites australis TaxID=29695 RepID=UPI002D77D982|nr:protein PIGMENT DEFECTIVE 338, chloroplastic-like isoform X2 [Phragmites australis]